MSIWKRLFGIKDSAPSPTPPITKTASRETANPTNKPARVAVLDFRSDSERQMERDGATGSVSLDVEQSAKRLYDLWRSTEIVFYYNPSETQRCSGCSATGSSIKLTSIAGGLTCPRCRRKILFTDYLIGPKGRDGDQKQKHRHKAVVEVGESLAKAGGREAMLQVFYRFAGLGGRQSDLSHCWHGTGGWVS